MILLKKKFFLDYFKEDVFNKNLYTIKRIFIVIISLVRILIYC